MFGEGPRDLRYALRRLRRSPLYTAIVVLTLATGIGVSVSVFSIVQGALLRPLPVRDAARVIVVWPIRPESPKDQAEYSMADYRLLRASTKAFREVSFIDLNGAFPQPVGSSDNAQLVNAALVGARFTQAIGVVPILGHGFDSTAGALGAAPSAMISFRYWQREYGSDRHVIGRMLTVSGERREIVGVLPRGFDYPRGADVWAPAPDTLSGPWYGFVGTLAPGATPAAARAEADAVVPNSPDPGELHGIRAWSMSLTEAVIGSARPIMIALSVGVGLLLLMTGVNVAALVLARAAARTTEVSLRLAIGASERAAAAGLLWECVCLAGAGAIGGVGIGAASLGALLKLAPPELPRLDVVALDWRGFVYAAVVAGILAVILAIVSNRVARPDRSAGLSGRLRSASRTTQWPSRLVVSQVALAVAIMAGAGVTIRSLEALTHVEMGFRPHHLLIGRGFPADGQWRSDSEWTRAVARVVPALDAVPGVTSATLMIAPPFTGNIGFDATYMIEGEPITALKTNPLIALYTAAPETFRTLGIPLVSGRNFTTDDRNGSNWVAIVSAGLARRLWPGHDAVGQRIRLGTAQDPWFTVVGIVGDSRYRDLQATRPTIYLADAQAGISALTLAVRTRGDPDAMLATIRRVVHETEPRLGIAGLVPIMSLASPILARSRFAALLLSFAALASLVLAVAGLYGALAALVESRRREMGIRLALGAVPRVLAQAVVERGVVLTIGGSLIGVLLAFLGTRVLSGLLYDVSPTDPVTFALVVAVMASVSILACVAPARRATKVNVLTVMRIE